jgi:hypothetical protein
VPEPATFASEQLGVVTVRQRCFLLNGQSIGRGVGGLCALAVFASSVAAQAAGPRLEILPRASEGWVRLNSTVATNNLLSLLASTNLLHWQPIAAAHDALFAYPDAASARFPQRFYRLLATPRTPTNDWKNQLVFQHFAFPEEEFLSEGSGGVRWVKFAILLDDPVRVAYQHSTNYPFHYDFARVRLAPFLGMDRAAFDAVSLHRTNQQVVLGAVLLPYLFSGAAPFEYGIQLVGLDPYPPEDVCRWLELVRATIHSVPPATAFYVPTFEQRASAEANRALFEAKGIAVASIERWVELDHCYAPGWAFGRLKYFPAAEINAAYADGRLRPEDILLTDGVPAETPLVAGIISLTPSTPNSHVAILAASFGVPFVYLPDEDERQRVQQLAGREVILRAFVQAGRCEVKVLDVEGLFGAAERAEVLTLKQPRPIQFMPKAGFGAVSANTDALAPSDIRFFGGKAANYGLLRRAVPNNCPPAIALSFDLWDAFLDQTLPSGRTLRAEIAMRLAPYTNYPPPIAALKNDLASLRELIRNTAQFTAAQQQAITNALSPFNPNRKIRFRSSTNVEDSEHFTGAGLYDSYSGCLLDDRDGDDAGPSLCDPEEDGERGVFRAIRRVYASFYNDNAFLERLRHGVDETKVGMGVLVHHSFPDEEELANGVAKMQFRYGTSFVNMTGDLVTQLGAESVTNPDGSAVPEVVNGAHFGSFSGVSFRQGSSRVPLGAYVMTWDADYLAFLELFKLVGDRFRQFYPAKRNFFLDFEYKKDVNLGLVVKQAREVPSPDTTEDVAAFLVDEPNTLCVGQEEFGDVFANHRLKSLWALHTANLRLVSSNLTKSFYRQGTLEYLVGPARQNLSGLMSSWPNASNHIAGDVTEDSWTTGSGDELRRWTLETTFISTVTGARSPIVTQQDFRQVVTVTYAKPVATLDFAGGFTTTTNESVVLRPCPPLSAGVILRQHTFTATNAAKGGTITVETSYYWPRTPSGAVAGYTAPLVHFVETRISGLTTNAIVLRDYYSQTYRPEHHNFGENFIFEPRLEPGLPQTTLDELTAANVQFLHIQAGGLDTPFTALGLDGVLRKL